MHSNHGPMTAKTIDGPDGERRIVLPNGPAIKAGDFDHDFAFALRLHDEGKIILSSEQRAEIMGWQRSAAKFARKKYRQ